MPREEKDMLIAEVTVATDRASRYIVQLCRHVKLAAQTHPSDAGPRRMVR